MLVKVWPREGLIDRLRPGRAGDPDTAEDTGLAHLGDIVRLIAKVGRNLVAEGCLNRCWIWKIQLGRVSVRRGDGHRCIGSKTQAPGAQRSGRAIHLSQSPASVDKTIVTGP